jgi:ATP/maltotriose-dependent transcriptional regulator MalT
MGKLDEARDLLTRSAESFKKLKMPWGAGSALNGLAGIVLASGDVAEANRLLEDATSQLRQAGPWFQMQVLFVRAIFAVRRGSADDAIALVRENLTRIRQLHDRFAFVYALVPLAAAAALKHDDEWAARILGVRDAVTERTGGRPLDVTVRDLRETAQRDASARLGPERWERAYAAGRKSSIDSADDLYRFVFDGR